MFTAIKDNKIIAISDTDSEFPCLVCDMIASEPEHTTSDYIEVGGEYVLVTDDKAIEKKKDDVRAVRNNYLEIFIDSKIKNPFMWDDLTEEDKLELGKYRNYLLDYTKEENWWERNPLTLEEWRYASTVTKNDHISDKDDTIDDIISENL